MIRHWTSNSKDALAASPAELRADGNVDLGSDEASMALEKTLGLLWNPNLDEFQFAIKASLEKAQSKREVLRRLMSVFDPLGFLASFLITGKFLLQETWKKKIGRDEPLPEDLQKKWQFFQDEVQWLKNVRIPRCYEVGSITRNASHFTAKRASSAFVTIERLSTKGHTLIGRCDDLHRQAPSQTQRSPRWSSCW